MNKPKTPYAVLVVDDEEPIRDALRRFLARDGFDAQVAASADEALGALRQHRIALMLCDIRMPGTSGIDLVPQALAIDPNLAILMLSAVNDATTAALCMQRGAMDYLTKPVDLADLARAVQRALKRRETAIARRQAAERAPAEPAPPLPERRLDRVDLERISVATLEALVNALEAKDPYMRGHSARIADLAATLAAELALTDDDVDRIRTAARLHDLGKIGTRDLVLNKHGPLTSEEFAHVKQHVLVAVQILSPLPHLADVIADIRGHHERWDGTGYPDGLRGDDIPLGARIIAAAEIFDALTTSRPYQEILSPQDAAARMGELSGAAIDPAVYQALKAVVDRRRTLVFLVDDVPPDPSVDLSHG
jgi:response regulator RpfG family c-di-GMP phosphodiesterase